MKCVGWLLLFEQYNSAKVWLILWSPCIVTRYPPIGMRRMFCETFLLFNWCICSSAYMAQETISHMNKQLLYPLYGDTKPSVQAYALLYQYVRIYHKKEKEWEDKRLHLLFSFCRRQKKSQRDFCLLLFHFPEVPSSPPSPFPFPLLVPISFLTWVKQHQAFLQMPLLQERS